MLFDFRSPTYVCNYLYNLDRNFSSANSRLPFLPLIVNRIIFTILGNTSIPQYTFYSIPSILLYFYLLLLYLSTFSPPYFCLQQSLQVFSLLSHLANSGWIKKVLWGLTLYLLPQGLDMDNRAHKHWFLIVQGQKIGMLQIVVSNKDICNQNGKPSGHLFPYPQPIAITSILYQYHCKRSHIPLSLAFLNTIHAPLHPYVLKYSPLAIEFEVPSN